MTSPTSAPQPTSAAAVAAWLQSEGGDSTEQLAQRLAPTVAAVNAFVRRIHDPIPAATEGEEPAWADDHTLGATMLAARLWRRRKSPEGVMAQFSAEGPVYVQRHDPDVAMLLQLGAWARPVVG
jgi:hypothetical protein